MPSVHSFLASVLSAVMGAVPLPDSETQPLRGSMVAAAVVDERLAVAVLATDSAEIQLYLREEGAWVARGAALSIEAVSGRLQADLLGGDGQFVLALQHHADEQSGEIWRLSDTWEFLGTPWEDVRLGECGGVDTSLFPSPPQLYGSVEAPAVARWEGAELYRHELEENGWSQARLERGFSGCWAPSDHWLQQGIDGVFVGLPGRLAQLRGGRLRSRRRVRSTQAPPRLDLDRDGRVSATVPVAYGAIYLPSSGPAQPLVVQPEGALPLRTTFDTQAVALDRGRTLLLLGRFMDDTYARYRHQYELRMVYFDGAVDIDIPLPDRAIYPEGAVRLLTGPDRVWLLYSDRERVVLWCWHQEGLSWVGCSAD